jgi:hypothetical protein
MHMVISCLSLAALLGQSAATAKTGVGRLAVRFSYDASDAPGSCPTAERLRSEIQASLERDPFQSDAPLLLSVKLSRLVPGQRELVAVITVIDSSGAVLGQQHIREPDGSCHALASAAAFAARLALEPMSELPATVASPPLQRVSVSPAGTANASASVVASPPPRLLSTSNPPVSVEQRVAHPNEQNATVEGVLAIGPIVAFGASVAPNLGLMVSGDLRLHHVSLGLQLRADLPASADLSSPSGASEQTWLLAGGVVPCGRFGPFAACGLLLLGREQSIGSGLNPDRTLDTFYGAAGLRLGYEIRPWRDFGFALDGDLLFPFARTQLYASDQLEWRTPPISASIWLAFESWIH